ncbi:hypothetical protein MMC25_002139 [Agyrium rufum]|nr:hypothetical protein [Agyrium rufum]
MTSTTLVTFLLQTVQPVASVHLLGSWDNFSKPYPMERDVRMGKLHWRGCHSFTDIICDGDSIHPFARRNGGLKEGGTYWYYYQLDGETEYYDPFQPSTTACPFLPGQPVNVLEVPIQFQSRSTSDGRPWTGSESLQDVFTLNPKDKFLTPKRSRRTKPIFPPLKLSTQEVPSDVKYMGQASDKLRIKRKRSRFTLCQNNAVESSSLEILDKPTSRSAPASRRVSLWDVLRRETRSADDEIGTSDDELDGSIGIPDVGLSRYPEFEAQGAQCEVESAIVDTNADLHGIKNTSRVSPAGVSRRTSARVVGYAQMHTMMQNEPSQVVDAALTQATDPAFHDMPSFNSLYQSTPLARDLHLELSRLAIEEQENNALGMIDSSSPNRKDKHSLRQGSIKATAASQPEDYLHSPFASPGIRSPEGFDYFSNITSSYNPSPTFSPTLTSTAFTESMSPSFRSGALRSPTFSEWGDDILGSPLLTSDIIQDPSYLTANQTNSRLRPSGVYQLPVAEQGSVLTLKDLSKASAHSSDDASSNLFMKHSGHELVARWNDGHQQLKNGNAAHEVVKSNFEELCDDHGYLGALIM